ncbi:hypothetical protein JXB11_04100 [Candidatus Woesearchaeota archaeon]|nr:hypothetical protein [Candidatus Woesearchaeota archaeon]
MKLGFYEAVATLIGTTVGAGILGIPYVVAKSGFAAGMLHILIIGAVMILLKLYMGEVVLRTKKIHQMTGYAERYLGRDGKNWMVGTMIFGVYCALIAYTIGVGHSLNAIFPSLSPFFFSMVFFAVASTIIYRGLKAVKDSELLLTSLVVLIAGAIIAIALFSDKFSGANMSTFSYPFMLVPFGTVLFAFMGSTAVPEMKLELGRNAKKLKKAIVIGGLIPIAVYALFALAVVGTSSGTVSEVATISLSEVFGGSMAVLANLFAVLAMGTSFIALGLALRDMYIYDYKMHETEAWVLTCLFPLATFVFGINSFIAVIGIAGAISGGLQSIIIVMMHKAAKTRGERKPEYSLRYSTVIGMTIIGIFIAGMIYQIATSFSVS